MKTEKKMDEAENDVYAAPDSVTLQEAKQHIEQIRSEKRKADSPDLRAALKLLAEELNTKETHFILEILQNAEDNEYSGTPELSLSIEVGNTKPPEQLLPDSALALQKLKLLWLSCGNQDGLIRISQSVHTCLKEKNVPHIWHVDGNAHNPPEWKNNLYLFSQRIFH